VKRVLAGLVAVLAVAVAPALAQALPSSDVPNTPGSISVPFPLSQPSAQPAVRSYGQLLTVWQGAGAAYGVPWQVLAAINQIESNFGRNMGPSSAGAVGWMQFMPSTWMRWGLDADGNGMADPWNPEDAVYAASRYLAAAGGRTDIERAIFAYNHAQWYVDEVLAAASTFDSGGLGSAAFGFGTLTFAPDYAGQLSDTKKVIGHAQRAISRARAGLDRVQSKRLVLEQKAGNPKLTDAEFLRVERLLDRVARAEDQHRRRLAAGHGRLSVAVARRESIRAQQAADALTADVPGAPAPGADGYVFPVGGGPSVVSVGHTHHDYPAADIAAPEGTPLYALANSVVTATLPTDNSNCGIGLELRTDNGEVFLYCHLSYLDPSVVTGTALAAGAPVGRVGSTGHATGPHLHLQFVPAVSYPQDESWFESYAGVAFSWQDASTPVRGHPPIKIAPAKQPRIFSVIRPVRVIQFTR
jgi:peptidase M23-like protein/transglycosylase-like protein with SLT domain